MSEDKKAEVKSEEKKNVENKNQKKSKKVKKQGDVVKRPVLLDPTPSFIDERMKVFDELKEKFNKDIEAKDHSEIDITLPDGSVKKGQAWKTTPLDIAKEIGTSFQKRQVVAKVDDELWDLNKPIEKSSKLVFFDFTTPEGRKVFWHSSAHILGEGCERHFGALLCFGPPTDEGFFYDMSIDPLSIVTVDNRPQTDSNHIDYLDTGVKYDRLVALYDTDHPHFHFNIPSYSEFE